ncbi:MAG TPA: LuxR C-terminal-related transcriptional regulator [Acidimicrobiales bacterium]
MAARLPTRVANVAALATPDDGKPAVLGVVAPGGGDGDAVLAAVEDRLRERGTAVLRVTGRRLERDHPLGAMSELVPVPPTTSADPTVADPDAERAARDALLDRLASEAAALVVADAQWLDPASLRVLVGVAERAEDRAVTVIVAHRPAAGDATLAALDAALSRRHQVVVLGSLEEDEVAERAALVLDAAVDQGLVERLAEETAGMPELVERLARAWAESGVVAGGRLEREPEGLAPPLVQAIRAEVDQLPPAARTVLSALSAGADLDDDLLARVTGLGGAELGESIDLLRAAGLVAPGREDIVPLVAAAVTELTPVADRRRFHARLAQALAERGAPPMQAAEHLVAAGAQGRDAAEMYVAAAEASLNESPELAREWFERAAAAGAPPGTIAAGQAEAAALDGDVAEALRLADLAASDPAVAGRDRAQAVVAALLPGRGFWRRSAAAYAELAAGEGPLADASALLAALGIAVAGGDRGGGGAAGAGGGAAASVAGGAADLAARVATARTRLPAPAPLELEALALAAEGLVATLGAGAADALGSFLEAAELLESAHGRLVLPDTPHALGSLVALALGELTPAEHLLGRARDRAVGGPLLRDRHRLLFGWIGLRSGRWAVAQSALDEVRDRSLTPRDQLVAAAIEAGLARRAGDLARLGQAWAQAEAVLLHQPADLASLDVIGELAVAASRLGLWERIAGKARELGDVVRGLGSPPLWALPLRWIGLQVALASDDRDAAVRRAAEIEAVPPVHPRLQGLADAAQAWVAILGGDVDVDQVSAAAGGLQKLGLTWEASRLTGQAAIRSGDPSVTRTLLEQARDLKATLPSAEQPDAPAAESVLSEREQMVAQYVVDGLTHKEIGAQLYISPKTVEHHVAKIRQKLGASTRAEMLAALRSQLAS